MGARSAADEGYVAGHAAIPRRFRLSYLVTAWTQRPEDEHRLLCGLPRLRSSSTTCSRRRTCTAPSPSSRSRPCVTVGAAARAGPVDRGHLVGAGRRAEAVARRRRDCPDRGQPRVAAGAPVREMPRISRRRTRRRGRPADRPGAGAARPGGGAHRAAPAGRADRPGRDGRRRDAGEPGPPRSGCAATRVPDRAMIRRRRRPTRPLATSPAAWASWPTASALAVDRRRRGDPDPDDRFRGLYISDAQVDDLLGGGARAAARGRATTGRGGARARRSRREADAAEAAGAEVRLRRLARSFDLEPLDVELLLVALAPDLDPRFERLYGYLHDDVSRRRASVGLALELSRRRRGIRRRGRARLGPLAPLVAGGLLLVEDADRPFLTRSLRVPDRVAAHLLGDDTPDPPSRPSLTTAVAHRRCRDRRARRAACAPAPAWSTSGSGSAPPAVTLAARALGRVGPPPVVLDLGRLGPGDDPPRGGRGGVREARLRGAGPRRGPGRVARGARRRRPCAPSPRRPARSSSSGRAAGTPPGRASRRSSSTRTVPSAERAPRACGWRRSTATRPAELDPAVATLPFRLAPEQIDRAAEAGAPAAAAAGRRPDRGATSPPAPGPRTRPAWSGWRGGSSRASTWDDLVLPAGVVDAAPRADRPRPPPRPGARRVGDGPDGAQGPRGDGAVRRRLGHRQDDVGRGDRRRPRARPLRHRPLDRRRQVHRRDREEPRPRSSPRPTGSTASCCSTRRTRIFGKRSEVKDAHDRYANVEVAYLLQRMERFDGLAILTTNLRANVDEAFLRRLDAIVDFPMPEDDDRRRLWERNLPAGVPEGRRHRPGLPGPPVQALGRQHPQHRRRRPPTSPPRRAGRCAWPTSSARRRASTASSAA